jgi:hypothetical protein
MARIAHQQAYPGITFRPRTVSWFARLARLPAECVHLEKHSPWMATLIPDTLYLRGKALKLRVPPRPEVSLCRACLMDVLEDELAAFDGRVTAFQPDAESFSQYFYVAVADFEAAGLTPELANTIEGRLNQDWGECAECAKAATWLWFPRDQVESLDDVDQISAAPGQKLCAKHGARKLCTGLKNIAEANLFYVNVPYGETGAYVWI